MKGGARSDGTAAPLAVILVTSLNFGGAEKQAVILANGLRERGWDVAMVTLLSTPAAAERSFAAGVSVRSLNLGSGRSLFGALRELTRLLRTRQPSALVTFMFHANVLGRIAGRVASVPVIVSSVRAEHFGGKMRDWLERLTEPLACATVVNSTRVGEALVRRRVIARQRLAYVPNAVVWGDARSPGPAATATRESLGIAPHEFLWLAVGRLEAPKDYANLLRAARMLLAECPAAKIRIAGGGYQERELIRMRDALGLQDAVEFLGFRADVGDLLNAADAYVLCSAWESSPNSVLEAMAAGVPVVVTDVGGLSDLVADGRTGSLVPTGQPEALAAAMKALMNRSVQERGEMGLAARLAVQQTHSAPAVCDRWAALLAGAIASRGRADGVATTRATDLDLDLDGATQTTTSISRA